MSEDKAQVGKVERRLVKGQRRLPMSNIVQLMIDGDFAIALLGQDLQSGACVCVPVEEVDGSRYTPQAQRAAAEAAFEGLKEQVGQPNLRYALHPSHPDFGR